MTKHFCLSLFAICLFAFGQANQEVRLLEPGKPLEREMRAANRTPIESS